jgi:hypothetical protein
MNITNELARRLALEWLATYRTRYIVENTPIKTLRTFHWGDLIKGEYDQEQMTKFCLSLDPRGCLGRVALCLAICEQHFAGSEWTFRYGEVRNDFFRGILMDQWQTEYSVGQTVPDDSWFTELLMYDEPHAIIVVNDTDQFDPLSMAVPDFEVHHGDVVLFNGWNAVACSMAISQAITEKDPARRLAALEAADTLCPGTSQLKEAKVHAFVELGMLSEAETTLRELVFTRPTAKVFWILETVFNTDHPARRTLFDDCLWSHLKRCLEREVSQALNNGGCNE